MFEEIHVVVGKIYPYLNSVKGLIVFGRNEPEATDVLAVGEIFSEEEKHKICVELILILLISAHRKDEAASFFITGILPFGLYSFLEVLNGVDPTPFVLN